jgi:NAD(P)-dependent dehydrogenase (short-subunit alcohol dehydrogenase family)
MSAGSDDSGGGGERSAVVVTGASTGIGRATALRLAELGFHVLAGVRREADGERLAWDAPAALTPLIFDLTDEGSIEAAAGEVEKATGEGGLRGLVNNAGTAEAAPIELLPLEALRRQLEVNLVGHIAVTQALLPALRRAGGRIVNVSSVGGRVSTPALGAYSASKFALEAISDALRVELRPWGIEVAVIEPGAIRTEIWRRGEAEAESMLERVPEEKRALYQPLIDGLLRLSAQSQKRAIAPDRVAVRITHALTARRPRTRYVVGTDARVRIALHALLPDRAYDALVRRLVGMR